MKYAQASREAIHAVVSALALTVDLASVFQGVSKGAIYSLRTIVCYFGHHYQVCCRLNFPWLSGMAQTYACSLCHQSNDTGYVSVVCNLLQAMAD